MFKIETEYGIFEAETEKEALKALAKGKKAHAKALAERQERSKLACLRADAIGYRFLRKMLKGESFPRGWTLAAPGGPYSAIRLDNDGRTTIFDCENGKFSDRFYGYTVISGVTNGSGYAMAFFLRDNSTGKIEAYALGAEGDVGAWVEVPGLTVEHFQREEQSASA